MGFFRLFPAHMGSPASQSRGKNILNIPRNNVLSQLFLLSVSSRGLCLVLSEEELFPELSMGNVYSFPRAKNGLLYLGNDLWIGFNYFRKKCPLMLPAAPITENACLYRMLPESRPLSLSGL